MISLIWAMDKNNLIGNDNLLPWHYKDDLKYFKKITLNKKCIMGLNTFNSILSINKKPLENRKLIVCSLNEFAYPNVLVINDLEKFLKENFYTEEEIFVIGGKTIYNIAFKYAKKLYITYIDKEHEGNVYFDDLDLRDFKLKSSNKLDFLDFRIYERKKGLKL